MQRARQLTVPLPNKPGMLAKVCRVLAEAKVLREDLRQELSRTHDLVYDYPFVWESWTARP